MSKYRAVRTRCNYGHMHASKREAERCEELHLLQKAGDICNLTQQPRFELRAEGGGKVATYVADFSYHMAGVNHQIVEDSKGYRTPLYRLKKRFFEAMYPGRKIVET